MCRVIFTPAARAELIEAQDWYENEAHLGRLFRASVEAAVERMSSNPLQFRWSTTTFAARCFADSRTH